jgi:hypothetical protein
MKADVASAALSPSGPAAKDAGGDSQHALDTDLAQLRGMLERGDAEGARTWVKNLQQQWPDNELVRHYAQVLAPPIVSVRHGHRGDSRQRERAWLREHAREYSGQWLAVLADQLVAADPDLDRVLAAVRETSGAQRPLLHFQPEAGA